MKNRKYYTQLEVDEYVRKLMTDSEIALSKQSERLEKEISENVRLTKELDEYKKKEKANARLLVLSERKAKYLEQTAHSKCAIELDRLARLTDKWNSFFNDLSNKYEPQDKEELNEFSIELSKTIDSLLDIEELFKGDGSNPAIKEHEQEVNRLNVVKEKKQNEIDDRFSKLVLEFNMKIGDNATRGRGRPKKSDVNNVKDIEKKLGKEEKSSNSVYIPQGEGVFDFEEALNPTDSLEDIMKDLIDIED